MTNRNIALTGHRPQKLAGYDMNDPFYTNLRAYLLRGIKGELDRLGPDDTLTLHSGLALGADTVWSQAAVMAKGRDARVRFVAHIPTPGQASKWPAASQRAWQAQRDAADAEVIYSPTYTRTCLNDRNIGMINAADAVIAVWDGAQDGGTWHAVTYARAQGKTLIHAHPDTFRV